MIKRLFANYRKTPIYCPYAYGDYSTFPISDPKKPAYSPADIPEGSNTVMNKQTFVYVGHHHLHQRRKDSRMNDTSHPVPEEAGKLLALIQCELNLSTKAMSNQLGITDVWMRRLLNNDIIPSQHLLKAIVTLYVNHPDPCTLNHRRDLAHRFTQACARTYYERNHHRLQQRCHTLFHFPELTASLI